MLDDPPGGPLAKYEMLRPLGAGGMGEVYLARDRALNRQVAIKVVSPDRLGDEPSQRRLVLEAQAAAALDHPCICPVYEAGTTGDGRTFIVMQYVEGETLAERLRRGPLDPRAALLLTADMADALALAHQRGIVHRDLKPQNIILTPTGRPKLLDFGLAKQQTGLALVGSADQQTRTTLTVQGAIVGTPGYMSPEQVRAEPLDGRSDLFSLGTVLFECLTGERAFSGPTAIDVFGQTLQSDPPPVTARRRDLPASFNPLVGRMLAKNPSERFQSASEVLGAARAILEGTRPEPPPAPLAWRPGRRELLGGAVLVALAGIAGVWSWTHRPPTPPPKAVEWYARGTAQIRDGAFYSATRALGEAVRLFPAYPQAQARLAEALSELDEEREAQATLLRASSVLDYGSARLSENDRLRFDAVRALVVRDLGTAVANHKQIVAREPNDAGAWLDLGRAQEEAGLRDEARTSYERALSIDGGYAAAHLRLGKLAADEERRADALKSFDAAEHYYGLSSNVEGQTEVLLRRGAFLNSVGEIVQARTVLNRAATLAATTSDNTSLVVRTMLEQASVTASEGRLAAAETIAGDAVRMATDAGLDTIAAEGLIESASTQLRVDAAKAEATLKQAIDLASRHGARHVAARASLQLAAMYVDEDRPVDGLALIDRTLPFLKERRYNRLELTALVTAARAYEGLGRLEEQLRAATSALTIAEMNHDEANAANALESLASHANTTGALPKALAYRARSEAIHGRLGDRQSLPYDIALRADLLIRLGRGDEAQPLFVDLDNGRAAGIDAYRNRSRRAEALRALRAVIAQNFPDAAGRSEALLADRTRNDSAHDLATVLLWYARARQGASHVPPTAYDGLDRDPNDAEPRELAYWEAMAHVASGDPRRALAVVERDFATVAVGRSDERDWRMAAIGTVAANAIHDGDRMERLRGIARAALERLRAAWKDAAVTYLQRPDLKGLIEQARL